MTEHKETARSLYLAAGRHRWEEGDFPRAYLAFEHAYNYAVRHRVTEYVACILDQWGCVSEEVGLPGFAYNRHREARRILEMTGDERWLSLSRQHMGTLLVNMGMVQQGIEEYLEAKELCGDDTDGSCWIDGLLGHAYLIMGEEENGLTPIKRALSHWQERGNKTEQVRLLCYVAACAIDNEDVMEAETRLNTAWRLSWEGETGHIKTDVMLLLARLLYDVDEPEDALAWAKMAVERLGSRGQPHYAIQPEEIYYTCGSILMALGREEQAAETFGRASYIAGGKLRNLEGEMYLSYEEKLSREYPDLKL